MERIESKLYPKGKTRYFALCTHPLCSGRGLIHCDLHPFDEEECDEMNCGMLEGPSECEIVEEEKACQQS